MEVGSNQVLSALLGLYLAVPPCGVGVYLALAAGTGGPRPARAIARAPVPMPQAPASPTAPPAPVTPRPAPTPVRVTPTRQPPAASPIPRPSPTAPLVRIPGSAWLRLSVEQRERLAAGWVQRELAHLPAFTRLTPRAQKVESAHIAGAHHMAERVTAYYREHPDATTQAQDLALDIVDSVTPQSNN